MSRPATERPANPGWYYREFVAPAPACLLPQRAYFTGTQWLLGYGLSGFAPRVPKSVPSQYQNGGFIWRSL